MSGRDRIAEALRSGALARTGSAISDPGNPGQVMALCQHRIWGQVLVATDGTPELDGAHRLVLVPVPPHLPGPLSAVAWTYDDETHPVRCTPALYALLSRRT